MVKLVRRDRYPREKGILGCYGVRIYLQGAERCNYPVRERADQHCDVERRHDEEIENAVLENGSHQAGHARLAPISLELEDEDDEANESNDVCEDVRFLDTCETVRNKYLRARSATCRPTRVC